MEIKVYLVYGAVPGKRFGIAPHRPDTGVYDECTVVIPDELIYGYNMLDEPILLLDGQKYALWNVLHCWDGHPALVWFDGVEHHKILQTA